MTQAPGCTAYFGAIGAGDKFGETLESCAQDDGVRVLLQKTPNVATGTCAVLINGGERSLVANLAAANTFTPAHLETDEAKDAISKAKILYTAGFFLTVSIDSILNVTKSCVESGSIYCLNLSAPFIIQFFGDQLAAAMPFADFVFANESEAETYGDVRGYGKDLSVIALKIAAQPKASGTRPRVVVFTQGSSATLVAVGGKVVTYPVEPLPKAQLVDTNGAGDAFVGGFLSQLVVGKEVAECVRAGHYAAREVIQRSGCTFPKECTYF
jgi:adenosine kinase